ncbi:MAG: metallophosphoesterase [Kiritimatiellae bacterium]|nr:metallophosphoesterase [Kiritimatiellia bacterium]
MKFPGNIRRLLRALRRWHAPVLAALGVLGAAAWAWSWVPETTVVRVPAAGVSAAAPLRLALVSDLHSCRYGKGQKDLIDRLEAASPDLVMLAGDILDDKLPDDRGLAFLEEAAKRWPCFYVSGNHEFWSRRIGGMKDAIRACGVRVLEGECVPVDCKGWRLDVCGVDDPTYMARSDWLAQLDAAQAGRTDGRWGVLLSHRPERADDCRGRGFGLVLSGHAHGGQIRIPFTGRGLYAPDQGFWPALVGGIRGLDADTTLVVGRGLARESNPYPRFFNRPELVLVVAEPAPSPLAPP